MHTVGIIGASGFVGYELLKILSKHPEIEVKALNSNSFAGKKVQSLYPDFSCRKTVFTNYSIEQLNSLGIDMVFLAVPHGTAAEIARKLETRIIDLSADHRFKKDESEWVYGLPELFRNKIRNAEKVANPGCYATSCILTALPLAKERLYFKAVFDCKSGYSGAGRGKAEEPGYKESLSDNIIAYNITKHKHIAEIQEILGKNVSFTPHVLQFFRGILCTAHFFLNKGVSADDVAEKFNKFYDNEHFVKIIKSIPELHAVQNNNSCLIGGFECDENSRLVVVSSIDNLGKGAAGQAVQNMNLMLGLKEEMGLAVYG